MTQFLFEAHFSYEKLRGIDLVLGPNLVQFHNIMKLYQRKKMTYDEVVFKHIKKFNIGKKEEEKLKK